MNVPGFDCRLPRIMGDWMVSIPAIKKNAIAETQVQSDAFSDPGSDVHSNGETDTNEQPYKEVLPDDPAYGGALSAARKRLDLYHGGTDKHYSRYQYCPDTTDIVDYTVTGADLNHLVPGDVILYQDEKGKTYRVPADYKLKGVEGYDHTEDGQQVPAKLQLANARPAWPSDGVPDRPHWVRTDTTDAPGNWIPKGSQWRKVLQDHDFKDYESLGKDLDTLKSVVELLNPSKGPSTNGVRLTSKFVEFATTDFPYGLWQENAKCGNRLANIPKVSSPSFQGAARPRWFDVSTGPWKLPPADAHVYSERPGAAIYNMVCVNCHGPQADSHGRQADTLQIMTGGNARVANFRDGLFGPVDKPGTNLERVFSPATTDAGVPTGVSTEEWGARYMAFMALGGTTKLIPKAILNLVASTPVFGVPRQIPDVGSANMLGAVQYLCSRVLGLGRQIASDATNAPDAPEIVPDWLAPDEELVGTWNKGDFAWNETFGFLHGGGVIETWFGDAELFARLCSFDNPPPVRALSPDSSGMGLRFIDAALYPPDRPVGTDRSTVEQGISATNLMPWCIASTADSVVGLNKPKGANGQEVDFPFCPTDLQQSMTPRQLIKWSYRGAINGGLAVFEYLKWLKIEKHDPVPAYDQCDLLP
jgi:hypothetical protein